MEFEVEIEVEMDGGGGGTTTKCERDSDAPCDAGGGTRPDQARTRMNEDARGTTDHARGGGDRVSYLLVRMTWDGLCEAHQQHHRRHHFHHLHLHHAIDSRIAFRCRRRLLLQPRPSPLSFVDGPWSWSDTGRDF